MKRVNDLLFKFSRIVPDRLLITAAVEDAYSEVFPTQSIPKFKIKDKSVSFELSGAARADLATQKSRLVAAINARVGSDAVREIR